MLARKLLALFKYITKKKIAYLMGIVHTEKLRISFLEPLLVYILFNFSKSIYRFNIYFRGFLALVPQAGGANDHPTFTNFVQLYRMLSTYNLLNPPQFGNCSVCIRFRYEEKSNQKINERKFGKNRFAYW
jgi:hypothetical protein